MPDKSPTSESKEVTSLKINLNITKGFLDLVQHLDALPDMKKTAYDETRSLYQAVSKGRDVNKLGKELERFFGEPAKPAGKPVSLMLRFNPSIKYLDGLRDEQPLYIKKVKTGFYYGALWPWRKDLQNITIHLGFCGHKMSEQDFKKLGELAKSKILHERVYEEFDSKIGARVHGISLASFLQMAAIEKTTCTLKIKGDGKVGYLYLLNGDLIDAATGMLSNKAAACKVLSWEDAVIEIDKPGNKKENQINQPLIQLLTEALKIRKKEALLNKKKPKTPEKIAAEDLQEDDIIQLESEMAVDVALKPAEKVSILKNKRLLMIAAAALVIIALGTVMSLRLVKSKRIKSEYQNVLLRLENQPKTKQKINLLRGFINSHPQSEYAQNAEEKIKELRFFIEEQDFASISSNADAFLSNNSYEKALTGYQAYLKKHPQSVHAGTVKQKIAQISHRIDENDYETFVKSAGSDGVDRIASYFRYLEKHPNGRHANEVKQVIEGMAEEYYLFFKKKITECRSQEDWETCVQLCNTFINIYPDNNRSNEVKTFLVFSQEKLQAKKTLADLRLKVDRAGSGYLAAKKIYLDYMDSHPDSPLRDIIRKDLKKLKDKEELSQLLSEKDKIVASLKKSKGKFSDNGNGTITDSKTGLMWSLLDSLLESKECLNYEFAEAYVKNLDAGGYNDWRLPTESELAGIYKTKPFFPPRAAEWYWTSKNFSRYSDGWQKMVYIVTTKRETEWEMQKTDAQDCGAVQAVRP